MVYLITGKMNAGKTSRTIEMANKISSSDGFVSLKTMNHDEVVQFELMQLSTKEIKILAINQPFYNNQFDAKVTLGTYYFDELVFEWALKSIKKMIKNKISSIFLDEVGMLEIKESGFYKSILMLLKSQCDCYFTIRDQFIPLFIEKFKINEYRILN